MNLFIWYLFLIFLFTILFFFFKVMKDHVQRDIWLYISAQGINLYERGPKSGPCGPVLYEMFEWKAIQTLCYSKHYLCILPHASHVHRSRLKKYKLKMDHKK